MEDHSFWAAFKDAARKYFQKKSVDLQGRIEVREQENRVQEWQWSLENQLVPALQATFAARRGEAGGQSPGFVVGGNGLQTAWLRVHLAGTQLNWPVVENTLRKAGDSLGYRIQPMRPRASDPGLPRNIRVYQLDFRARQ